MAYYSGIPRQTGAGLGAIFSVLGRQLLPALAKTAVPFIRNSAKQALPQLAKAGIGLISDMGKNPKRNFKQALKSRSKRLLSDVINQAVLSRKRQKSKNPRRKQTSAKRPRKKRRDIFS